MCGLYDSGTPRAGLRVVVGARAETRPAFHVFARDRNGWPIPGAKIEFVINGQAGFDVANAEGRGSIESLKMDDELLVRATYDGETQEARPAANANEWTFQFNVDTRPYRQSSAERWVAILTAVSVIALVGFLVIRNEPFSDRNLVVLVRIILSLAVAVLGATIPGFLNFGWNARGFALRAGGALALFALTFLLTPSVLPSLNDAQIAPLKNPKKIGRTLRSRDEAFGLVSNSPTSTPPGLGVRAVYEGSGESQRKLFDVILSNSGAEQRLLSSFRVRWLYAKGLYSSIEEGKSVKPVERYALELQIDPDRPYKMFEKIVDVYPPLILPSKNESGPSVTSIRLEVLYTFEKARIHWHPNSDWDIYYEVSAQDDKGSVAKVLSRAWRGGDKPNWVSEYEQEHGGSASRGT